METISIWHWLIVLFVVAPIIPSTTMLRRVGKSRWWALLSLLTIFGPLIVLCFIAYSPWPAVDKETPR